MKFLKKIEVAIALIYLISGFLLIFLFNIHAIINKELNQTQLRIDNWRALFLVIVISIAIYFGIKKGLSKISASEKKYRNVFDNNPTPMWIFDAETRRFVIVNKAAIKQYGFSEEEFLRMTINDIRPKDEIKNIHLDFEEIPDEFRHAGLYKHMRKNKEIIIVKITSHKVILRNRSCRLIMSNDVTELLKAKEDKEVAEEKIKATLDRYETLSKSTNDAIWDLNLNTNTIEWNYAINYIFGYEMNAKNVDWWYDNLHPEDRDRVKGSKYNAIANRNALWTEEYRFRCANGSYKYVLDHGILIYDEDNNPIRMIGAMQDIDGKHEQENQINKLSLVARKTSNGVIITDINSKIEWANEAFLESTGYSFEEIKGKHPASFLHGPDTSPIVEQEIIELSKSQKSFSRDIINYRKDGSKLWLSLNISPVFTDGKLKNYITIQTDITELKLQQQRIFEQNRRLREIAFMNSHLVRAPLANILALTSILDDSIISDPLNIDLISHIKKSARELDKVIIGIVEQAAEGSAVAHKSNIVTSEIVGL